MERTVVVVAAATDDAAFAAPSIGGGGGHAHRPSHVLGSTAIDGRRVEADRARARVPSLPVPATAARPSPPLMARQHSTAATHPLPITSRPTAAGGSRAVECACARRATPATVHERATPTRALVTRPQSASRQTALPSRIRCSVVVRAVARRPCVRMCSLFISKIVQCRRIPVFF